MKCELCQLEKTPKEMGRIYQINCIECRIKIKWKKCNKKRSVRGDHKSINEVERKRNLFKNKYNADEVFRKKENLRRIAHFKNRPDLKAEREKRTYYKNIEKSRARGRLRMAVYRGTITKPKNCSNCHCEVNKIEAHHTDYTKPFDVTWLCVECHKREHGKI